MKAKRTLTSSWSAPASFAVSGFFSSSSFVIMIYADIAPDDFKTGFIGDPVPISERGGWWLARTRHRTRKKQETPQGKV
jgi:hypothetical protein